MVKLLYPEPVPKAELLEPEDELPGNADDVDIGEEEEDTEGDNADEESVSDSEGEMKELRKMCKKMFDRMNDACAWTDFYF